MKILEFNIDMPVKFVSGGHFISSGSWLHPVRTIDTYVLIIGESGTAHIREGDAEFNVGSGDALLLPPFSEHGGSKPSEGVSYYWFHFNKNMLQHEVRVLQDALCPLPDSANSGVGSALYIPQFFKTSSPEKLAILCHQLLHIYKSRYGQTAGDYMFTSMLLEVSEQFAEHLSLNSDADSRSFYKICEWIRINSNTKISLTDVAEQFRYNKNYLCRMFKRYSGATVQEYINRTKISNAKNLLFSSDKSVQEIAYQLGFSDEKYMMRLFKQQEGMTPSQFRNAYFRTHLNRR